MKRILVIVACVLTTFGAFADDFCSCWQQGDEKELDEQIRLKTRELRKVEALNNQQRIDSLARWLENKECVLDIYVPKNRAYILTTTRFLSSFTVSLRKGDASVEKTFEFQTLYHNWTRKLAIKRKKLRYIRNYTTEGVIAKYRSQDSLNEVHQLNAKYDSQIQFQWKWASDNHGQRQQKFEEASPIFIEIIAINVSDKEQSILWPKSEITEGNMIYFQELANLKGMRSAQFTESRNRNNSNSKGSWFEPVLLRPGDSLISRHYLFLPDQGALIQNEQFQTIHKLPNLKRGKYDLRVWYAPPEIEDTSLWIPRSSDSVYVRPIGGDQFVIDPKQRSLLGQKMILQKEDSNDFKLSLKVVEEYIDLSAGIHKITGVIQDSAESQKFHSGDTVQLLLKPFQHGVDVSNISGRAHIVNTIDSISKSNSFYFVTAIWNQSAIHQLQRNGQKHKSFIDSIQGLWLNEDGRSAIWIDNFLQEGTSADNTILCELEFTESLLQNRGVLLDSNCIQKRAYFNAQYHQFWNFQKPEMMYRFRFLEISKDKLIIERFRGVTDRKTTTYYRHSKQHLPSTYKYVNN